MGTFNIEIFFSHWKDRRLVSTKDFIFFARVGDEDVIDLIPLAEVVGIEDMDGIGPTEEAEIDAEESTSPELPSLLLNAFQIRTLATGYNRS